MSKSKKTERIEIRLTTEEKQKLLYNSKLMGITATEYILLCIRRKRIVVCDDFPKLIYHLSKIGNNINQIVAVANTNKYISQSSIDEIKNLMTSCYGKMSEFIDFITEPELENISADNPNVLIEICERLKLIEEELKNKEV